MWIFQILSYDVNVQVCGLIGCNSFQGLTFWDQLKLPSIVSPSDVTEGFKILNILGLRLKMLFAIEEPSFFTWVWFIVKNFMSEKLRSRVTLCGSNFEQIVKEKLPDLDIKMLPKFLGGEVDNDSEELTHWITYQIEQYAWDT